MIRETGGSTDVVEGAPHFTVVTFAGTGFAPESLVGRRVHVSAGTGAGQTAIITSNTENTITLDQQWATTLDASSRISIDGSDAVQSSTRAIITGRMPGPFQPNHHAVHLIAGVHYRIDLEGLATGKGDNRDPFLWVYNQNGHRITRNDDGGVGLNSALTLRAGYTGRHTLIAGAYGFNFGSYTLTTRIQDEIPGNINTSIPVNQGGSLGSTLSFSGDEDWYAVDMQIGLQYTFDAIGASGGGGSLANPGLRLMDDAGNEILSNDDHLGSFNPKIVFAPSTSGRYYIAANSFVGQTGSYVLETSVQQAAFAVTSTTTTTFAEDHYEVVLTAQPDDGSGAGFVEVTVTPEITKTTRTGGVRTDDYQVQVFNLDGLPVSRIRVDPSDSRNLIVRFDQTNWDEPIRVGVRAIDDAKVDGGDTKVFANAPNTVSRILGPVTVNGAGGDGSLVGLGDPELLPHETNLKEPTGDIDSIDGTLVTLQTLSAARLSDLGLTTDLSDVEQLVGRTIEVVRSTPDDAWTALFPQDSNGNPRDPAVGQFRLITAATVSAGQIVLTLNERFGVAGTGVSSVLSGPTSSFVDITLSLPQQKRLGLARIDDLPGRYLELHDADGQPVTSAAEITGVTPLGGERFSLTIDGDLAAAAANIGNIAGYFLRNDDRIKSYAITRESLNFFVDEPQSVDVLFVHDEDSPTDSTANDGDDGGTGYLTATRLWGLNMGPDLPIGGRLRAGGITYANLEVVDIDLGRGNNDFNVLGTHARADDPATIDDETFQTWTFINGGDDILWPITGRQGDHFTVSTNVAEIPLIVGNSADGGNAAGPTQFAGLHDADGNFGSDRQLVGQTITLIKPTGGQQIRTIIQHSNDTLWIDGGWSDLPVAGDTYMVTNPIDGALAIDGENGDDIIDASAATAGIVAFGGLGNDTLRGGSHDDILFGDRGRVDYFAAADAGGNRAIVTRLGTAPEPILGTVTGDFDVRGNLVDAGAAYPVPDDFDSGLRGLFVDINNGTGFLETPRLITTNDATSLSITPDFGQDLDATSQFRISTLPEDQTDGIVRGPGLIITVDDAQGGNDTIIAGAGNDQILGGAGNDDLFGRDGNDVVLGDIGAIDMHSVVPDPAPA
ncbi:MAG: hypothetical protein AAFP69_15390, partial [Planctomycetota bacterium]